MVARHKKENDMNEIFEELTRGNLLALLDDLGGSGESVTAADDQMLEMIVKNRLSLVVDMARIEAALTRPMPTEWRARLTERRIELDNAARAVRDAASGRQPPRGNLVINVPDGVGISHFYGNGGRLCCSRVADDGRLVLDLFMNEFRNLLASRQHGRAWETANPEALQRLGEVAR